MEKMDKRGINLKEKLLTENMLNPHGTTLTVLVDGLKAKCVMGAFGTWSDRFNLTFESEHPSLGKEFSTKYFEFLEPGFLGWGHEGEKLRIVVLDEENLFNENAASHAMG